MAAKNKTIGEEAEENGFGEAEDVLSFDSEPPTAEVEEKTSKELRLKIRLHGGLRDLSDGGVGEVDGSHGGREGVEDGDGEQPTALVVQRSRACRQPIDARRRRQLRNGLFWAALEA